MYLTLWVGGGRGDKEDLVLPEGAQKLKTNETVEDTECVADWAIKFTKYNRLRPRVLG